MGSQGQFFPQRRYATTLPAMSASYKGAGHGTIKPIVNNIKSKKEKGTYTEQFGMRAFRYVVDTEITETVSEEYRNKIASSLLAKYE